MLPYYFIHEICVAAGRVEYIRKGLKYSTIQLCVDFMRFAFSAWVIEAICSFHFDFCNCYCAVNEEKFITRTNKGEKETRRDKHKQK